MIARIRLLRGLVILPLSYRNRVIKDTVFVCHHTASATTINAINHGLPRPYKCDMSDADKPVEETTEEIKPEESKSEEDASKQTTSEEAEETPDYEALFKQEQERLKRAEHKIIKLRAKTLDEPEEVEPEETKEDLKSYVDKRLNQIEISSQQSLFDAEIERVSSNESEAKLIRLHLENNSLSGTLSEKVQKAKALANYPKVVRAKKELSKALETKPGNEDSSSYKPKAPKILSDLTERDIAFLKKRGIYDKYLEKYGK